MIFPGSEDLDFCLFCWHYIASCSTFRYLSWSMKLQHIFSGLLERQNLLLTREYKIQTSSTGIKSAPVCVKNCICVWHSEDRGSWYILIIKQTRCTLYSNLFLDGTLHVLDRFSVHHQES